MAIFYTDSSSFNDLKVSGSTVLSTTTGIALQVKSSGSTIFSVSGSSGEIFNISDVGSSTSLFTVASSSITIFNIDSTKSVSISGSLVVTGSITGSLQGTSSYAITASYALFAANGGGSSVDTGSFVTTSSFNAFTQSINTATSSFVTNSQTSSFVTNSQTSSFVQNSQTSSFVQNSQTSSFVTNSQTSSMTVATASFATNFTIANTLTLDETLTDFAKVASTIVGSNLLFQQATGSHTSAHGKYTVYKDANARAGEFVTVWNGTTTTYFDNATTDIGNTADITFQSAIVSSQIHINTIAASSGWTVKMLVTYL